MAFQKVVGHEVLRDRLLSALVEDRLAHAYLFHGLSGVGGEALAIELAKAVNCEEGIGEPCQNCRSCRATESLQHPDLHVYLPASNAKSTKKTPKEEKESGFGDSGKKDPRIERRLSLIGETAANPYRLISYGRGDFISVDDIRELRREASGKPFQGRRKVALIFGADRLNTAASNALLKTLEEPPGGLLLLLVTDKMERLLPTIVSRCQPVHLAGLQDGALIDALQNRFSMEPADAALGAALADGSLGKALQSLSDEGIHRRKMAQGLLKTVHDCSLLELFEQIDQLVAISKDPMVIEPVLDSLLIYYRDLLLLMETGDSNAIQHLDSKEWLEKTAPELNFDQVSGAIEAVEEMRLAFSQNAHTQLALTVLALRLKVAAGAA